MATSTEFIEFVCEQIPKIYDVRYKKMFGEYMVYVNDKPILLVCDNCVFVKKIPEVEPLLKDAEVGTPYNGAKEHFILDIEMSELMSEVTAILERVTPMPQPRKKSK